MERILKNSYLIVYCFIIVTMYFLLVREGYFALSILFIFFITSIPFLLIQLERILNWKYKFLLSYFSIFTTLLLELYAIFNLHFQDYLLIISFGSILIILTILEKKNTKKYLVTTILSYVHLFLFFLYVLINSNLFNGG